MDRKEIVPNNLNPEVNEHEVRLEKIKKLELSGISPWPSYKPVSHTTAAAKAIFEKDATINDVFTLAGRLMTRRDHGKTYFCNLQDRDGKIQVYIKKDTIGDASFDFFKSYIDIGDIVWIKGTLFVTKMGELTVNVQEISLLSKCLHALPEKFHGLVDTEQRYRQRYLDLISNADSKEKFKRRSLVIRGIRDFLQKRDFLEVETPMLHPIAGGATARPFVTHHNAYDMDLYLRIAPELYLKRLVIGGFERVFEINRSFRNEGVSTRHNPEYSMLEFYMAHGDCQAGIDLTEQLLQSAIQSALGTLVVQFQGKSIDFSSFKRLTVKESLIEIGGLAPESLEPNVIDKLFVQHAIEVPKVQGHGAKLFALFEHFVEPKIVQPTFIIGYPVEVSPLAKRDPNNPNEAARFELFVHGMELANGYTELNDPFDQAERFRQQGLAKEAGDQEAHSFDHDYIAALEYGLAPTVGVGIGIDRLIMIITDTTSIKDVILFPTLKQAKE